MVSKNKEKRAELNNTRKMGRDAFKPGINIDDVNPFTKNSECFYAFKSGWSDAQIKHDEKVSLKKQVNEWEMMSFQCPWNGVANGTPFNVCEGNSKPCKISNCAIWHFRKKI